MLDSDFCLSLWDKLNVEAVLVVDDEQFKKQPKWMAGITKEYRGLFSMGVSCCTCSMREAVSGDGIWKPENGLNGVGYFANSRRKTKGK